MGMMKTTLLFFSFAFAALPALAGQEWMSVAVQEGALRAAPMPFGKIVANLSYGDRVDVLTEQGPWLRVREQARGREGWMHSASLVAKKLTLQPGEKVGPSASADELALGGKGFNAQVEAQYKARQQQADYGWVERMERVVVQPEEMQRFLREGGLVAGGEVQP